MNAETQPIDARAAEQAHLLQVYGQFDFEPVAGEGVYLHCRDGRTLLDLYGGHAVAALGYGHPAVVRALADQAQTLSFQSNAVALEVRAQAADRLAAIAPDGLDRVFLCNSGAEANENALRVALRATGRRKVLALEHGFHGRTAAAAAVTWGAADKWYGFPRTPFDVDFMPRDNLARATAMIDDDTAAVIVEVVQGIAGAYALEPEFVAALASACRAQGALLIVDEVQSGVGRTGDWFAAGLYDLEPDLLTTAKALGAGFPCAALMMTEALAGQLAKGDLGTTFGGAPLACATICAVIDTIEREGLLANVRAVSARIRKDCVTGPVDKISGRGFLLGLHCAGGAQPVREHLLKHHIITGSSNDPKVLRLLPPLTLGDEHVDALVAALEAY